MSVIVTVAERRAREAERRRAAAEMIASELLAFARQRNGRFFLFGSAARGTMNDQSDLDVLIDVPVAVETEAWSLVERLSREHDLPADIHSAKTSRHDFLARVAQSARVLA